MLRIAKWMVLIFVGFIVARVVIDGGVLRKISPDFHGTCIPFDDIQGAEDMEVAQHFLILSSNPHPIWNENKILQGTLYMLDLADPKAKPQSLTGDIPFDFHPHGISLFEVSENDWRIFVVNHRETKDTIEIFDWNMKSKIFSHSRTVEGSELLANANDLQATGAETFLLTHDHGALSKLGKFIEDFTKMGRGYVTYFDGKNFTKILNGLSFANGIVRIPKTDDLYIASMLDKKISHFRWTPSQPVKYVGEINLSDAPDNMTYNSTSETMWVGVHPKLLALKFHSENPKRLAPSKILRISSLNSNPKIEEIFEDDGRKISAASSAIEYNNNLYIGSIYDHKLLRCNF
jgi:arylesterase/paraoxonase